MHFECIYMYIVHVNVYIVCEAAKGVLLVEVY